MPKQMKVFALGASLAAGAFLGLAAPADASVTLSGLSVTYYSGFTENPGTDITFSGTATGPFSMTSISETADYGGSNSTPSWPAGTTLFGADITGTIDASAAGNYTFSFGADDAAYVFVNGTLDASIVGGNSLQDPLLTETIALNAGSNTLEIQYANEFADQTALVFTPVPEPATWAIMLAGFAGIGAAARLTRRRAVPSTV